MLTTDRFPDMLNEKLKHTFGGDSTIDFHIRQYYTADETPPSAVITFFFTILWYGTLIISIVRSTVPASSLSVMLIAGLLPILTLSKQISIAIQEYKKRRKYMREGQKNSGEIIAVKTVPHVFRSSRHIDRITYRYVYTVRFTDISGFDFDTQEYARPIHKNLATPYVTIYSDLSNRRHFIADFQVKNRSGDPGPFSYQEDAASDFWSVNSKTIYTLIYIAVVVMILLRVLEG